MRSFAVVLLFALGCAAPVESGGDLETGAASGGSAPDSGGAPQEGSGGSYGDGGTVDAAGGTDTGGALMASGGFVSSGGAPATGGEPASGGFIAAGGSSGGSFTGSGGAPVDNDTDDDGVPNAIDQCEGGDDTQDLNENGEIDECEPGWCLKGWEPDGAECVDEAYGVGRGYCTTVQFDQNHGPGSCIQCQIGYYNCDGDPLNDCEVYSPGAHPCD